MPPEPKASSRFRIDWVLRGELALGPAPRSPEHLVQLEAQGIGAVLSLCSSEEWPLLAGLEQRFLWRRHPLPDHRSGRDPAIEELEAALALAIQMQQQRGPLFVHCIAAMERSPLLCLAWLKRRRRLSRLQALDYLMQVHPGTMPLPGQLSLLDQLSQ
ncbi:dual specificity protein phosphatase family protein [Synechococcus sp. CCY 0621]|uniref:protein-tyrosine phosphatase family protein n=1 Tax=Synechococcus sp. CCY 0621 TaxID=2815603 RepID=UPI001C23EFAF|nr:dual specificity protein phosphatase family protein [Synechococcus sp. CCY 0621]